MDKPYPEDDPAEIPNPTEYPSPFAARGTAARLSKALEQYRVDSGLSYKELGEILGTSRQNATNHCTNAYGDRVRLRTVCRIVDLLDFDPIELFWIFKGEVTA